MNFIRDVLQEPLLTDFDINGQGRLALHSKILDHKRMLREVFEEFHHLFRKLDIQFLNAKGLSVELGAGIAPIRDSYPDVLATDIVQGGNLDLILNAEAMDLKDGSVRVFYGQNCFHHFPNPSQFFRELDRTLAPGGGAILLEPYYGPFATFLYKRLFKTEGFDKSYPYWENPISGPMNGANQALSYIVFIRDRARFVQNHPSLKIVHQELCGNYLKYLLSGGLNFRQLCPDMLTPIVDVMQWCLYPLNPWLSLHHVVVIRKETT